MHRSLAIVLAVAVAVASGVACNESASGHPAAIIDSSIGEKQVDDLTQRFRALRVNTLSEENRTSTHSASVSLPARADEPVTLEDDRSHVHIRFALRGATASPGTTSKGLVLYPSALGAADLVHRVSAEGTEDFVAFESRPPVEEISYDVDVSSVAGLRLVSNTLELLGADGAPRLRVAPPFVIDGKGRREDAALSVTGCAYDVSPAGPWGRMPTPPGSTHCVVHVGWSGTAYPLLVDPGWQTTGSMAVGRSGHTATLLGNGKVVVIGGVDDLNQAVKTVELYDPASGTFSATASATAHGSGTAILLSSGKVLMQSGGEVYDPTTGTFSTPYNVGAFGFVGQSITLIDANHVLSVGGNDDVEDLADVYLLDWTIPTGAYVTPGLPTPRSFHAATLLGNGRLLIAGGQQNNIPLRTALLYDPSTKTFAATAGQMISARNRSLATLLPSGKVLLCGDGIAASELYDPVSNTFSATGSMKNARLYFRATRLADGEVLIVGGGSIDAELYDEKTGNFTTSGSLTTSRSGHTATLLPSGKVLVAGGVGNATNTVLKSVELYDPANFDLAAKCVANEDCNSGFCVDGVCCDDICDGQCEACDVTGHAGVCSNVVGAPHGPRGTCAKTADCSSACDGVSAKSCIYAPTLCGSTCANGTETDSTCDSQGACAAQKPFACQNLACADAISCKTSCVTTADCRSGLVCSKDGTCAVGGVCDGDHASKDADGVVTECAPYKCGTSGACEQQCASIDDCVSPNVCDPTGKCVPTDSGGDSGGCNSSGRAEYAPSWELLGLALVLTRKRRKNETSK